ncbi:hypothetical protein AB0M46_26535 [Dactylosporangium sp. NPDC051485]|uniref:hypothetical protein n=1 Tax=Dactylosporangium sp. NPDC051485 TaxID=3154846 RepID=UPI00341888CE
MLLSFPASPATKVGRSRLLSFLPHVSKQTRHKSSTHREADMKKYIKRAAIVLGTAGMIIAVGGAAAIATGAKHTRIHFQMVRSANSVNTGCLPKAKAEVTVQSRGQVEVMTIAASGLPKNTDFDLFVIQVPNAPFGLSWYQGDLNTNQWGVAAGTFVGRFSIETFSVAPGTAPAPVVHTSPIADASSNPTTAPVHQYHLGLWFNSPEDAVAAGCSKDPKAVTPFNGDHTAGPQVLSTRNFSDAEGPLRSLQP